MIMGDPRPRHVNSQGLPAGKQFREDIRILPDRLDATSIGHETAFRIAFPKRADRARVVASSRQARGFSGLSGLVVSIAVHTAACLAALNADPPAPTPPAPEPMALMVEFVSDPTQKSEPQPEITKGDRQSLQTVSSSQEIKPIGKPVMPAESRMDAPPLAAEVATIPVPISRPQPIARKKQVSGSVKGEMMIARGSENARQLDAHDAPWIDAKSGMVGPIGEETTKGVIRDLAAQDRWKQLLQAHLDRRKRYPITALTRHQEGIVYVSFIVAPNGSVSDVRIKQSSNVPALDQESLDLVQRAAPLPPPPPDVDTLVYAPISFSIRR